MQDGFPDEFYTFTTIKALFEACGTLGPVIEKLVGKLTLLEALPITCIISDFNMVEAHKAAIHLGLPTVAFSTQSALALSAKYYCHRLVGEGLLPLPRPASTTDRTLAKDCVRTLHQIPSAEESAAFAREVTCVPGMYPIPLRDYYSPLLVQDLSNYLFQLFSCVQMQSLRNGDWILMNTFHELEAPIIDAFQQDTGINLTTIGPLVAVDMIYLPEGGANSNNNNNNNSSHLTHTGSFWPVEESKCMAWLDKHNPKSVIYVSFGSLMHVTKDKLQEFVLGLEDSQAPFLLVLRPNVVDGGRQNAVSEILPLGFEERTKPRSLIVSWAPQLRVLGHPATAGFVTHCGWNSLLESISMGVPMLGYPYAADQPMNNRYNVSVWKLGLEFVGQPGGILDRHEVAVKVKALLMDEGEGGLTARALAWKEVAQKTVNKGGASYHNTAAFVADMFRRAQGASLSTSK